MALFWILCAGSAGMYLFGMDFLYDLEHGIFTSGGGGAVEAVIVAITLVFSLTALRYGWTRGRAPPVPLIRAVPLTSPSIHRFPVKSCRGEACRPAVVEPWGLAGDRRWMVVDEAGDVDHRPRGQRAGARPSRRSPPTGCG